MFIALYSDTSYYTWVCIRKVLSPTFFSGYRNGAGKLYSFAFVVMKQMGLSFVSSLLWQTKSPIYSFYRLVGL
jgi:hypothetical protein